MATLCSSSEANGPGVFSSHLEPSIPLEEILRILEMRANELRANQGNAGAVSKRRRSVPAWILQAIKILSIDLSDLSDEPPRQIYSLRASRVHALVRAEFARHLCRLKVVMIGKPLPLIGNWGVYLGCEFSGICGITAPGFDAALDFGKLALSHSATGQKKKIDPLGSDEVIDFVRQGSGL